MRSFYAAQLLKQYLIFLLTKRPVGFYIKTLVSCEGEITTSKSYQTLRKSLEVLTPEDNSEKAVTELEFILLALLYFHIMKNYCILLS